MQLFESTSTNSLWKMESNSYPSKCGWDLIICYDENNTAHVVNNNMAGQRVQNMIISKSKSPMDVNFNFLYLYSWLWNNLYVAIINSAQFKYRFTYSRKPIWHSKLQGKGTLNNFKLNKLLNTVFTISQIVILFQQWKACHKDQCTRCYHIQLKRLGIPYRSGS